MTHTLKKTFAMLLLAIFGSAILYNCEPDPDSLGEQLFDKDAAQGTEIFRDIVAYNYNNNDSIRSDASRLISGYIQNQDGSVAVLKTGVLGAFTEGQFGMQKASYITQLRLLQNNPDFTGPNAKVDSVVLVVRPPANTINNTYFYEKDSLTTTNYSKSDYPVGNEKVPVSIVKKTYPVRKYGKVGGAHKNLKINVHEITTFIDANNNAFTRSNVNVGLGEFLGSGVFDGKISSIAITKTSDNENVFTGNVGFRINLSNTNFFQTRVIDKKGQPELQDASNFIRHFRGIRLSVEETDGYLFQFSPDDMELIMYYKYDKTENNVVTRPQTTFRFNLGGANAHIGQYEYDRSGSALSTALASNDNKKLFVQGMGGPSIGVKIPDTTIGELKALYEKDKIGIIGAKLRFYVDPTWSDNSTVDDRRFIITRLLEKTGAPNDLSKLTFDTQAGLSLYYYNGEKKYYDFVITKTLKDIIEERKVKDENGNERTATNEPFYIGLGSFVGNASGMLTGGLNTTRASYMNRLILTGSENGVSNKAQLILTYATKK